MRIVAERGRLVLLVGDTSTLALFVYIGQRDHELTDAANPLGGLLYALSPFLLAWLPVAFAVGAYRVGAGDMRWRTALGHWLNAWLIAAPLGILLRAFWFDRAVIPTNFVLAAVVFGGAMLLTWRVVSIPACQKVNGRV